MNKKIWVGAIIVIAIALISWRVHETKQSMLLGIRSRQTSIKLGVILPLTGDSAVVGEELKKGIDLAIDQLHAKAVNIVAVYEDDKFDPKEAVAAANKLITLDKVDFAMLFSVEEARPIAPIFNNNRIPLIAAWDSNNFLKNAGPYIFSNGFSTEKAGEIMADFAYRHLKLKNVAVLGHVDAWSEIISKAFVDQFKKDGGNIVYMDSVQVGTNDFRLHVVRIKGKNPDGVYFPIIPFDSVSFIKQADENGLKATMMSGDALIQGVIDATGRASEGIYFSNGYSGSTQIAALYKTKYQKDPYALVYAASGFDALMKIGLSFNSSNDIKGTFDKVFGPTRSADRLEKIFKVINGKPIEVENWR